MSSEAPIQEVVDRETRAWDTKDVQLLLSVFHPDMVWAWPANANAHDPIEWHLSLGRFDALRWTRLFEELFRTRTLVHNRRETMRIEVSAEGDGALSCGYRHTLAR